MATRDLTSLYMECRKRKTAFGMLEGKTNPHSRLLEGDDPASPSWRVSLPPKWVDTVDRCEAHMEALDKKLDVLTGLHTKRLMVSFADDSEAAQERNIEAQTIAITQTLRKAEKELKLVVAGGGDASDEKIRRNIQMSLAKKLQQRSTHFRGMQKDYMTKLQRQKSGASGSTELDFLNAEARGPKRGVSAQQISVGFTSQQLQVVDDLEAVAAERDEEIGRIAQSIEELSQIFKELAVLVIDQGTILDRIDFNMEQVVEHTKEGLKQLDKAEQHQKSARPIKCIMLLLFLISIMLTALVLKHQGDGGGDGGGGGSHHESHVDCKRVRYRGDDGAIHWREDCT